MERLPAGAPGGERARFLCRQSGMAAPTRPPLAVQGASRRQQQTNKQGLATREKPARARRRLPAPLPTGAGGAVPHKGCDGKTGGRGPSPSPPLTHQPFTVRCRPRGPRQRRVAGLTASSARGRASGKWGKTKRAGPPFSPSPSPRSPAEGAALARRARALPPCPAAGRTPPLEPRAARVRRPRHRSPVRKTPADRSGPKTSVDRRASAGAQPAGGAAAQRPRPPRTVAGPRAAASPAQPRTPPRTPRRLGGPEDALPESAGATAEYRGEERRG